MKRHCLVNYYSGQEEIKQKKNKVTYHQSMALSKSGGLDNSQTSLFQLWYLLCDRPIYLQTTFLLTLNKENSKILNLNQSVPALSYYSKWNNEIRVPLKSTEDDHTIVKEQSVCLGEYWLRVLSILNFLELGGGFLQLPGWHHRRKGRHQRCTCSWTLQVGKNS